MQRPYNDDGLNKIYDLLFCDDADLYRSTTDGRDAYPWSAIFADPIDRPALEKLVGDPDAESRLRMLAANMLGKAGIAITPKHLFGTVVEVGMAEGLDVVAAYEDGTARYINYSGKLIVWETSTSPSDMLIRELMDASQKVVDVIGPWDRERLGPPKTGNVRMTFLVSDGLYFGEGPFDDLARDPMGGPVISSAAELMNFLIGNSAPQSR
jgi:hypothetical protein